MIFFFFSIILFFCAIIESRLLFKVSSCVLALYFSLTFAYGYDWLNYYQSYLALGHGGDPFFGDLGFIFLMKICIGLGLPFPVYSFLVNIILYSLIIFFSSKMKCPSFCLFALFAFLGFFMFTEQIRQGLALSIVLFGFVLFFRKSNTRFLLVVAIACLFHMSAIMALFYYILSATKRKYFSISLICCLLFYGVFITLMSNPQLVSSLTIIESKFETYGGMYADVNSNFLDFIIHSKMLFVYVFIVILLNVFGLKINKNYPAYSSAFLLVLTRSSSLLVRVGYYFLPFFLYSIDGFIYNEGKGLRCSWKKLTLCLVILFVSTIPIWTPMYKLGANSNLNILSTSADFNREIGVKCNILHISSDIRTDGCS